MPRLILLNGPPGCGKSTLARRYAEAHPLALNLDVDRVRGLLGGWRDHPERAGLLARAIALAAARAHLAAGHDVVVPQFLGRPDFPDQLARLAGELDAAYHEIVLLDGKDNALRRFTERSRTSDDPAHLDAAAMLDRAGGLDELSAMYDRLMAMLATRPHARIVPTTDGRVAQAYRDLERTIAMTVTPMDQLGQLGEALDEAARLVAGTTGEQWAGPTPCAEWTVRKLVNHMVGGNWLFAAALGGDQRPLDEIRRPAIEDQLGADPHAAFRASADAVLIAFRQPGVLEKMCTVPFGTVPGIVALHLRTTEMLAHGWDLARATGQTPHFPDAVVAQELAFTQDKLAGVDPARKVFGTPQPVADDAPVLDRLAALLGRTPAAG